MHVKDDAGNGGGRKLIDRVGGDLKDVERRGEKGSD